MINYHLKWLYKTNCYKTKSNFSQFFFSHWLLYECFYSFLINALVNFEKLIRFYRKKWRKFENTDRNILPKPIISNVISAFSDLLKPNIFSSANHGGRHRVPPLLKISWSAPDLALLSILKWNLKNTVKTFVTKPVKKCMFCPELQVTCCWIKDNFSWKRL